MKRILTLVLAVALCITAVLAPLPVHAEADTDWYSENQNNFFISTAAQLAELAELVNSGTDFDEKNIYLEADIDLSAYGKAWRSGRGWVPIGQQEHCFKGRFYGKNHVISGLYINDPALNEAGLFGSIDGGTVTDLGIAGACVKGGSAVGGVAGRVGTAAWMPKSIITCASVINCFVTGSVAGTDTVGGIVGSLSCSYVNECRSDADVTGQFYIGGIVGAAGSAGIENCISTRSVSGTAYVGGIAGKCELGSLYTSYATGSITGADCVGGIIGSNNGVNIVRQCVALNEEVCGVTNVGRIAGQNDGTLHTSYALDTLAITEDGKDKVPLQDVDGEDIRMEDALTASFWRDKLEYRTTLFAISDGAYPVLSGLYPMDGELPEGTTAITASLFCSYVENREEHPQAVRVSSGEMLQSYLNAFHDGERPYGLDAKYDSAFFAENDLVFAPIGVTGVAPAYRLVSARESGDAFEFILYRPDGAYSADMASWILVLELAKDAPEKPIYVNGDLLAQPPYTPMPEPELDTSGLEAAIARAEALDLNLYTSITGDSVYAALKYAGKALESDSQQAVDAAAKALNEAVAALVEASCEHDYKTVVTKPTCTEKGYTTYTCSKCGDSYKADEIEALGHNFVDNVCIRCGTMEAVSPKPCPSEAFTDTPAKDNWAHMGIDFCLGSGYMKGVSENRFDPFGIVTRAQLVTILYRFDGEPGLVGLTPERFIDVPEDMWYSEAIAWASGMGIVNGVGNGKFDPNGAVTREQIATILYRYFYASDFLLGYSYPVPEGSLSAFPDADDVSSYAADPMLWAAQSGLINGIRSGDETVLAPKSSCTRAQIATIIMRLHPMTMPIDC